MKDDIIQGLKMAMLKGETLQQAMQSFYNSGYERKDIEDAARELQGLQSQLSQESKIFNQNEKMEQKPTPTKLEEKSTQVVSNYEQPQKSNSRIIFMITILLLLIIVGAALAGIYLYRETVMNYITNIFG
ncbi:hypothetical protein HYT24_02280 [Candidatus Pacearchaeota archaeon]|nr:hypothetical protein [Candidatus Pacearchaeota archaeon]